MHDAISFLKEAVRRGSGAMGAKDCYIINPTNIRASNDILHAGIDWPSGASFTLPAEAVDSFLARTSEVKEIKVGETTVTFRTGRLRSVIERRFEEPEPAPVLPEEWYPVPAGFTDALKVARQFTDDTATGLHIWKTAVRVWDERITACSGRVLIDVDMPGLTLERPKLLGKAALDFLGAQGCPDEFGVDRNTISFRWDDGRWVRCQTINAEMPEETFKRMFSERLGSDAPVKITDDWRAAHADAVALGDSSVGLTITGFKAIKEHVVSEIEVPVDVPTDHASWWGMKDLGNVLAIASAWNPLNWPEPALFVGEGFRGAIVGMQR